MLFFYLFIYFLTWLKWFLFIWTFLSPLAAITVPGVIVHLLCTCVILPNCDEGSIFYKDIHICMWVNVSMLNSHVLCERPQFKTMMLKHFWGSLLIIIMISAIRIIIRFCWVGVLLYVLRFYFLLFIYFWFSNQSVLSAMPQNVVVSSSQPS